MILWPLNKIFGLFMKDCEKLDRVPFFTHSIPSLAAGLARQSSQNERRDDKGGDNQIERPMVPSNRHSLASSNPPKLMGLTRLGPRDVQ